MRRTDVLKAGAVIFIWVILAVVPPRVFAAELAHEFIGAKKCSTCHKKEKQGEQYQKWQESRHAHAYETLGTPEAKESAAKLGIDDPQTSGKCLKCHSTAYGFTEERISETIDIEEGVSCESCHGPGGDYRKKSIMKDQAKAIMAGLILGGEKVCLKCHNEESPTFESFDFEEKHKEIAHPVPEG